MLHDFEIMLNFLEADNINLTGKVDCLLQLVRSFNSSNVRTLLTAPEQTPTSVGNCVTNITICKNLTAFSTEALTAYMAAPQGANTEDALTNNRIKEQGSSCPQDQYCWSRPCGKKCPSETTATDEEPEGHRGGGNPEVVKSY